MTSEEVPQPDASSGREPGEPSGPGGRSHAEPGGEAGGGPGGEPGGEAGGEPGGEAGEDRGRLNLTDPKAIRALAHPVRWALLEALGQAGTLTATQASEMLGESPANCAFHLRTLAKYGFVEEAGGGRGRERPWRQCYDKMSWRTLQDDPQAARAAEALDQVWLDRSLTRARRGLTSIASWPKALGDTLGGSTSRVFLTPEEAGELYTELSHTFNRLTSPDRYRERRDPKRRPANALPIEFILLGYPVLDLPPLPETDGDAETGDETAPDG